MDETPLSPPGDKLVLLVDDDESLLDLMEHVVKAEGFRTDRAEDGPEALRKAAARPPDLLILDMMLPGLGGYEVLRQLQASGQGDIPIIIVTGRQMDPKGIELIRQESNVKEFLEKPVRPAVLTSTLHRLLQTQPKNAPPREPGS
jgi:two-component system, OmpR family, response regulator ResD